MILRIILTLAFVLFAWTLKACDGHRPTQIEGPTDSGPCFELIDGRWVDCKPTTDSLYAEPVE